MLYQRFLGGLRRARRPQSQETSLIYKQVAADGLLPKNMAALLFLISVEIVMILLMTTTWMQAGGVIYVAGAGFV